MKRLHTVAQATCPWQEKMCDMVHQQHTNEREKPPVAVNPASVSHSDGAGGRGVRKRRFARRGSARDDGAAMESVVLRLIVITLFSLPAFALVWIGFLCVNRYRDPPSAWARILADEFLIYLGHVPPLIMLLVIAICITPRHNRVVTGIVLACIYALCAIFCWMLVCIGVVSF